MIVDDIHDGENEMLGLYDPDVQLLSKLGLKTMKAKRALNIYKQKGDGNKVDLGHLDELEKNYEKNWVNSAVQSGHAYASLGVDHNRFNKIRRIGLKNAIAENDRKKRNHLFINERDKKGGQ